MRVLIVKLSSLGDVVHTMPVVHDIVAAKPGAQIDWVVEPGFAPGSDFSLLPEYDTVSKYFYMSVFGGNTTLTGTTINVYTPRPPQLN